MKKTLIILLAFAFLAGVAALRPAAAAEREKILSPDQIKHYREIIKEGRSLFGIRIENREEERDDDKSDEKVEPNRVFATSTGEKIEKILTPAMISSFEKIRKIGASLWGVRKGNSISAREHLTVTAEMSACVAGAIDVKDKALIERANAAAAELVAAISARSACQQAAVQATASQRDNLGACVKTFEASLKSLREHSKTAHRAAWDAYQASLKVCRANSASATANAELIVEDGSNEGTLEAVVE